jgi:DNA polymerase-3 subunit epsilon
MIDLIFDTETTGIKAPDFTPEIVQIAAILQDRETRRVYHEFCMMVTPKSIIPEPAAEIHGITTEMARDHGFSQAEAEGLFIMLLADADRLVAHNIAFDVEMLKDNWPDAWALAMEKEHYDTMHELTPVMKLPKTGENHFHDDKYPDFKAPRLQEAHLYFFGTKFPNAHDAMIDTRACRNVYFAHLDTEKNKQ